MNAISGFRACFLFLYQSRFLTSKFEHECSEQVNRLPMAEHIHITLNKNTKQAS